MRGANNPYHFTKSFKSVAIAAKVSIRFQNSLSAKKTTTHGVLAIDNHTSSNDDEDGCCEEEENVFPIRPLNENYSDDNYYNASLIVHSAVDETFV